MSSFAKPNWQLNTVTEPWSGQEDLTLSAQTQPLSNKYVLKIF